MPRNLCSHSSSDGGMGLQMPFEKADRRMSEMGLKMPSREYDGESLEMGLKMPSIEQC